MATFTPDEAYQLLRDIATAERDLRRRADQLLVGRDMLIRALDGDPGIRRAGLAHACGLSRSRVTRMLNHEGQEPSDGPVAVPAALRAAIQDVRPDLGGLRSVQTRAA